MKKHNFEEIKITLNQEYDFSEFLYKNINSKSKVICKIHGTFLSSVKRLLRGQKCKRCANKDKIFNKEQFVEKSNEIHNNEYNYETTNYTNSKCKVNIECKIHGEFFQFASNHLKGYGCTKCRIKKEFDRFKIKANELHQNKFNYNKSNYKNNKSPINIECLKHGDFMQRPDNHLQGNGCPSCSISKGEIKVIDFLKKYNINFETQKTFDDCKNKYRLRFDFYLKELNICIEYDGPQHYKCIKFFGGYKNLQKYKKNDNIKNLYCINNNVKLIRINSLQEDNIETYLLEKIINKNVSTK